MRHTVSVADVGICPGAVRGRIYFQFSFFFLLLVDILDKIWKWNQKYGLVRLWLGPMLNVFICTAEDAEIYYYSPALYNRSEHFEFLKHFLGNGLLTANGKFLL